MDMSTLKLYIGFSNHHITFSYKKITNEEMYLSFVFFYINISNLYLLLQLIEQHMKNQIKITLKSNYIWTTGTLNNSMIKTSSCAVNPRLRHSITLKSQLFSPLSPWVASYSFSLLYRSTLYFLKETCSFDISLPLFLWIVLMVVSINVEGNI